MKRIWRRRSRRRPARSCRRPYYREQWRPVVGYEGLYNISNYGRVWSVRRWRRNHSKWQEIGGHLLQPGSNNNGRDTVSLWKNSEGHTFLIHQLVARAFIGKCPRGMEVSHKDGDLHHNHADNLLYETRAENNRRKIGHGTDNRGEKCYAHLLTSKDVMSIRLRYAPRGIGGDSGTKLAEEYGVHPNTIYAVANGHNWRHL